MTLTEFKDTMSARLAANKRKGGWHDETFVYLLRRAREELVELEEALIERQQYPPDMIGEAADAANFCYMIADNISRRLD